MVQAFARPPQSENVKYGLDPYTYLVDVLQRVGQHPAAHVAELTPLLWKILWMCTSI